MVSPDQAWRSERKRKNDKRNNKHRATTWAQVELTDAFCVEFCHVLSRFHLRERIHDPDSVFRVALKD